MRVLKSPELKQPAYYFLPNRPNKSDVTFLTLQNRRYIFNVTKSTGHFFSSSYLTALQLFNFTFHSRKISHIYWR